VSPRTGRPTEDPKTHETRIRMSDKDIEMLEYCCKATGRTKADIIREGIREVYERLRNE
jgi:predicted DNA-binding protein